MNFTQIRNATALIEAGPHRLLVDPMLAPAGAIPALKYATARRRRNPLVPLPDGTPDWLDGVTAVLITHCQKGHFDHIDRAAVKWIRETRLPVYCMQSDADFLTRKGLEARALEPGLTQDFLDGRITPVPCLHGRGLVGRLMAHGYGYVIDWPDEPTLYLAGDTILTETVRDALRHFQPDVTVVPAGGARFDIGDDIIMGREEALEVAQLSPGIVVANHLEALDHCPVTRADLRRARSERGLDGKLLVPEDGEMLTFVDDAARASA